MRHLLVLVCLFISTNIYSQLADTTKILQEGQLLYRSEKASWYATEYVLAKYTNLSDSLGGYLSYCKGINVYTLYYSKFDKYHILLKFTFDSIPKKIPITINDKNYKPDELEYDLITIRENAMSSFRTDTFFRKYRNVSPNPIPLIQNNQKRVFIISGTNSNGVVLIGNDYVLDYDSKNNLVSKRCLHNSLISLPMGSKEDKNPIVETGHSHVLSDLITSTDICTLLLYRDLTQWNIHYVVGKVYDSIFDMQNEKLKIMLHKEYKKTFKSSI